MNEHITDGRPTRTRSESGIIKENLKKALKFLKHRIENNLGNIIHFYQQQKTI